MKCLKILNFIGPVEVCESGEQYQVPTPPVESHFITGAIRVAHRQREPRHRKGVLNIAKRFEAPGFQQIDGDVFVVFVPTHPFFQPDRVLVLVGRESEGLHQGVEGGDGASKDERFRFTPVWIATASFHAWAVLPQQR